MNDRKFLFMQSVLGTDGAKALKKAAERSHALGNALLPRTILAWLGVYGRQDYEGELPGVENTYLQFTKNEEAYTGIINIGDENYSFEDATLFHIASAIGVALGADSEPVDPALRGIDLVRLGKSIDVLAKAKAVQKAKAKQIETDELEKGATEAPGKPAAPKQAVVAPQNGFDAKNPGAQKPTLQNLGQPRPPQMQLPQAVGASAHALPSVAQPKITLPGKGLKPQVPKLPSLKVTKNESERKCTMCGRAQFQNEQMVGCLCFRDLAKHAKLRKDEDGYTLTFDAEWDEESLSVFISAMGKR